MNLTGAPIIITICYIIGEIYKKIFKKNKKIYKYIPSIMIVIGGLMGILMYIIDPQIIFDSANIYQALIIGMISGITSTGTNQVVKQLNK